MTYANRYPVRPGEAGDGVSLLRWQWERRRTRERRRPAAPILGVEPDLDRIHRGDGVRATWVGHATVLLQVGGLNVLTDPHFRRVASPLPIGPRRHQPPGLPFEGLPRIDVVVVSHNHYDHLDRWTVRALMRRDAPTFLVPEGVDRWFARAVPGAVLDGPLRNVVGMRWDEDHAIGDVRFRFLAVQHWSARGLRDRDRTLWGSWAVLAPDCTFWFSGDLGYSPDILDVHASIGDVDLAAISIGAYEPRRIMRDSHLDPGEAVAVMEDLRARSAFAIHWGTFEEMTDEPLDEPPLLLRDHLARRGIAGERFLVPRHGETLRWDGALLR